MLKLLIHRKPSYICSLVCLRNRYDTKSAIAARQRSTREDSTTHIQRELMKPASERIPAISWYASSRDLSVKHCASFFPSTLSYNCQSSLTILIDSIESITTGFNSPGKSNSDLKFPHGPTRVRRHQPIRQPPNHMVTPNKIRQAKISIERHPLLITLRRVRNSIKNLFRIRLLHKLII